jgi:hypothetical protein
MFVQNYASITLIKGKIEIPVCMSNSKYGLNGRYDGKLAVAKDDVCSKQDYAKVSKYCFGPILCTDTAGLRGATFFFVDKTNTF